MYIRGKVAVVGTSNAAEMFQRGIPAYSLWSKSAVIVGSQVVEQINGYGRLATALVDLKLSPAGKSGMSPAFALTNETDAQTLNTRINGRLSDSVNADSYSFAAPLPNLLSLSEKLLPAEYMPSMRIELTLDILTNIFAQAATNSSADSLTISNLELVYTEVQFGGDFAPTLMSLADSNGDVLIKSQSYQTATQTLAGIAGTQTLTYNQRLSSVKSVLAYFDGVGSGRLNGIYDAVDVTRGEGGAGGSYQFQIGGVYYPQVALDTARCRAGVFAELSNAFSPSHDYYSGQMAISPLEWSRDENSTTSQTSPGKFFIGVNTERLDTNGVMLSGVSTALVPISLNVRCDTAPSATLAHLVTLFDAIIQVNLVNKTCSVKI
tara:strand:- start:653 stop:1786 length:1134 start_codon:yes stop_codon:yes gene_type:complete